MNVELARRLLIERAKRRAPVPVTPAERAWLELTQWTDEDQFIIVKVPEPSDKG